MEIVHDPVHQKGPWLMEEWLLQFVQFVWFKDDVQGIKAQDIYLEVFEEEAESIQNNRSITPASPFLSQAAGSTAIGDQLNQVIIAPGRIDVLVGHPDRQQSGPWGWKLSTDGKRVFSALRSAVVPYTDAIGSCSRVAVVLTLIRNLSSSSAATRLFLDRTGLDIDPAATDLNLQLNFPKQSVSGVKMNRILKFGTANMKELTFALHGGAPSTPQFGMERHVVSMQIDVNTVSEAKTFSASEAKEMLDTLSEEAFSMAAYGKLPGKHENG